MGSGLCDLFMHDLRSSLEVPSLACGRGVPDLDDGEVHLWSVDLDQMPSLRCALLVSEEMERANRLVRLAHRRRFMKGRGVLRLLLGEYLRADPAGLRIVCGRWGKPGLLESDYPEWRFNVAHSENEMVIGITKAGCIGVDVEKRRWLADESELVRRYFERDEVAEYEALPDCLRTEGFINGWTRKEAVLKARGEGLGTALDSFSVTLDPREGCRIRSFLTLEEDPEDWTLLGLKYGHEITVAVAVKGGPVRIRELRFEAGNWAGSEEEVPMTTRWSGGMAKSVALFKP
jgi:4'-phosphopantetheinyl transferase